jgi:hypothetical protein
MNDMITIGLGVVAVAIGAVALFALAVSVYNGVHGSLASARVGEVYNYDYEQPLHGEHKRVLAKVIEPVYTLEDSTIKQLNRRSGYRRNDPIFHRTKHIVVCEMPNGDVRQFYAERAKNVRRTVLGNQLFKVAALL